MTTKTSNLETGVTIIEVSGALMGGDATDALRQSLADAIQKNHAKLLVDLGKVTYVNSTAIGILMSTYATYARHGWRIVVCGLNKEVHAVFAITRMNQVYDVFDSRKDALEKM